jgi:hypothetical protein
LSLDGHRSNTVKCTAVRSGICVIDIWDGHFRASIESIIITNSLKGLRSDILYRIVALTDLWTESFFCYCDWKKMTAQCRWVAVDGVSSKTSPVCLSIRN